MHFKRQFLIALIAGVLVFNVQNWANSPEINIEKVLFTPDTKEKSLYMPTFHIKNYGAPTENILFSFNAKEKFIDFPTERKAPIILKNASDSTYPSSNKQFLLSQKKQRSTPSFKIVIEPNFCLEFFEKNTEIHFSLVVSSGSMADRSFDFVISYDGEKIKTRSFNECRMFWVNKKKLIYINSEKNFKKIIFQNIKKTCSFFFNFGRYTR
ncbi:MAG: hypothetical protein ABIH85_01975 [Candidatus Omnitrophota bacterium]